MDRVILLIHGIRTQAEWQGLVQQALQKQGSAPGDDIKVVPLGYEYFDVFRFLCPFWTRRKAIERMHEKIRDAIDVYPGRPVSIVAHSFGTYLVVKILESHPDIGIERLVL